MSSPRIAGYDKMLRDRASDVALARLLAGKAAGPALGETASTLRGRIEGTAAGRRAMTAMRRRGAGLTSQEVVYEGMSGSARSGAVGEAER
jgi:hypothetical protein